MFYPNRYDAFAALQIIKFVVVDLLYIAPVGKCSSVNLPGVCHF